MPSQKKEYSSVDVKMDKDVFKRLTEYSEELRVKKLQILNNKLRRRKRNETV